MTATIIDGKAFADKLISKIAAEVPSLPSPPGLTVVLVGEDPASRVYVANKAKRSREVGFNSIERRLSADTSQDLLLSEIESLNTDPSVHGILVQLPLPKQIDAAAVLDAIDPVKDVDGFHVVNVGRLSTGRSALVPCTPKGCMMLIEDRCGDIAGARAVVVGRSNIVGKPMAQLLLAANATVTIAHSRTKDLPAVCREADILIAAVGRPGMVRGDWIREGATVIDVGINRVDAPEKGEGKTKLVGDVMFEEALARAGAITPVPGGVGPMTIACLLDNTVAAYRAMRSGASAS